ncbi:MAG: glycoside hydrolase family 99-like domain-containing protein [Desulfobulbus sp.]
MLKVIAFYLPQYHPVPENDLWWGRGFTEWTNVAKARPLFKGHYQPHLPGELGFYDLRLPEVRNAQAEMAQRFGIDAFCYYHYWFNGRRVLERPFSEVFASGKPDYPFCLCWANENWTRAWDGGDAHILLKQKYSPEDDRRHIRQLLPAFEDRRYLRVNGKPLFLVYRTELLPDPRATAEIWREEAWKAGLGAIYLARVESKEDGIHPTSIGFDAAVEFAPDWRNMGGGRSDNIIWNILRKLRLLAPEIRDNRLLEYDTLAKAMTMKKDPGYIWFRCVCPSFDNSARRRTQAAIYYNATPEVYGEWLCEVLVQTIANRQPGERLVFVNAWNEWGEGCHLEPDQKWGDAFLRATREAKERGQMCHR